MPRGKSSKNRTVTIESKKQENQPKVGPCLKCINGYIMSDGIKGNPLIIKCGINDARYPQSWICTINAFILRTEEYIIHPMIYLNRENKDSGCEEQSPQPVNYSG